MKILITGICGFVGSSLALELKRHIQGLKVVGIDNLSRAGSEHNRALLKKRDIQFLHGDIRQPSDLDSLPKVDWVIDAAANPVVTAGVTGPTSSRQIIEHNLCATLNLLEYCKRHKAGLLLLSTSRVYSIARLNALPIAVKRDRFSPRFNAADEPGLSSRGVSETFSTAPPLSLYGTAKLASEMLALEYGMAFGFPVQVNRCGLLAGAGQFGKPDQGIVSYWIHSFRNKRPLKYIGFGGRGFQVRDCLHPRDLAGLVAKQLRHPQKVRTVVNVSGGSGNTFSLASLSQWCAERFGSQRINRDRQVRTFDVPWLVLDSRKAEIEWGWRPTTSLESIFEEIARHAEQNPGWLDLSD